VVGCLADGPCEIHGQSAWCAVLADGPWCLHERSVIEGAVLVVRELISDGPPQPRGQSARCLRTVRLVLHRVAKSFASCVLLSLWDRLGFVPRVGRSVVTTRPWQTCVEILGCEFGA
jgi:hypothetical protein